MLLKTLRSYLRITSKPNLLFAPFNCMHQPLLQTQIRYLQSDEQPPIDDQRRPKKPYKKKYQSESSNQQKSSQRTDQQGQRHSLDLTKLLKNYRIRIETAKNQKEQLSYHVKKIANYYRKINHAEFVQQRGQIQNILENICEINLSQLELYQYFNILDFVRICSNLQSISYPVYIKARDRVFKLLANFQQTIQILPITELSTLYCKITPLYHPDAFRISGLLHDKLANELQQNKRLSLTLMQIYVLIRSMGKKEFLAFPDKKILEMLLQSIKQRTINDPIMTIQLAVALKDIQVEVNISDCNMYEISENMQEKAVELAKKGLQSQQIKYLLMTRKSDNPYFIDIFAVIARKSLQELVNEQKSPSFDDFKQFIRIVSQIPRNYRFELTEKQAIAKFCERFTLKVQNEEQRKRFEYELLELIRSGFFDDDLALLDDLFREKQVGFFWSFPLEYSHRNIPFPLSILEEKITDSTSIFRIQANNIKIAVTFAIQSKLHPDSQPLKRGYQRLVENISNYKWSIQDLQPLNKFTVFDPALINAFHNEYNCYYLSRLLPTKDEILAEKNVKKGEKSRLLKFWSYLLLQDNLSHDLIAKIPVYAIYVSCFRQKKIKNQEIHPKLALLLAINIKLSSGKIKLADQDSLQIIELLTLYSSQLSFENQYLLELYWSIVTHFVDQYGYLRKTSLPYANYLFSKLLNIGNEKIKHSLYYKNFLQELIKAVGILTISNTHSYFKTSIIREGLHHNLISDLHLPQLEITYYTEQEKQMLNTLIDKYIEKELAPSSLISYLKMAKLPANTERDLEKILDVISQSTIQELSQYLIHYSFGSSKQGDKILTKICSEFIHKLTVSIDFMSILRNITQLSNSHFQLFKSILLAICDKLSSQPSAIYLVDHHEILKALREHSLTHPTYEQSLWQFSRQFKQRGSVFINILIELNRSKLSYHLTGNDIALAEQLLVSNPYLFLELMVYHEDLIDNFKLKAEGIVEHLEKPIPQSLFVAYLQSKYDLLITKSKSSSPALRKANFIIEKLLKLLQSNQIKVKIQQKNGENIYILNEKILLIITKQQYEHQCKVIHKMVSHLYPKYEIIELNVASTLKDTSYLLSQLNITDGDTFTAELVQKIEGELRYT